MSIKRRLMGDRMLLRGGSLVTGDGTTFLECASIRIRQGLVAEMTPGMAEAVEGETVITTSGMLMMPGFINGHAHATIAGPSMPSGSEPLLPSDIRWQRNRHLLSGTTSLVNVCGLALPDERDGEAGPHPMDIHMTSAHTPHSILAADQIDGRGLLARHRTATIDERVQAGCRVLGEAGGGQTLGGGAQEYRFIPDAIEERTGQRISVLMARRLKEAVLGRKLDGHSTASQADLRHLLEEPGQNDTSGHADIARRKGIGACPKRACRPAGGCRSRSQLRPSCHLPPCCTDGCDPACAETTLAIDANDRSPCQSPFVSAR